MKILGKLLKANILHLLNFSFFFQLNITNRLIIALEIRAVKEYIFFVSKM